MTSSTTPDLTATIHDYMDAFERRDVQRCVAFFRDDATVHFQFSRYQGAAAIAAWHQERFDADLRVIDLSDITVDDRRATVEASVASERLRRWNFDSLNVTLTFEFDGGRIGELTCGLRATPW